MSELNAQQEASPQKAQSVVNIAPGETEPKQVTYEDLMNQLQQLEKQITEAASSEAEIDALQKKVADLEAEISKKATKKNLSKKISELSKQLSEIQEKDEDKEEDDDYHSDDDASEVEAKRANGKGIVAVDELQHDVLGNYDWFKDLLKAHKKLTGFR